MRVQAQGPGALVRTVNGERVACKFYVYTFAGYSYFRNLIVQNGGRVLRDTEVDKADFAIHARYIHSANLTAPLCYPQFIRDCVRAGRMQDHGDYLIEDPGTQNQRGDLATQESRGNGSVVEVDEDEDDVIVQDVRRLYGDETLDADDHLTNSLLESQSRNISEYVAPGPGSPGAYSINSVDISDSDYRTKRTLDRAARSFNDMPAASSSLARSSLFKSPARAAANEGTGSPARVLSQQPVNTPRPAPANGSRREGLRSALASRRSPSFVAARNVFEPSASTSAASLPAAEAATRGPSSTPRRSAGGSASKRTVASDRPGQFAVMDPELSLHVPPSPELEMPLTQAPMGPDFAFIQNLDGNGGSQESFRGSLSRARADEDRPLIQLVHTLSDEEYPDPMAFLVPRNPGPNTSEERANGDPQQAPASETHPEPPTPSGKGRKRRRGSTSESGYGEQPVPVVVKPHAASAALALDPSGSQPLLSPPRQLSQTSQATPGTQPMTAVRSRSFENCLTSPGQGGPDPLSNSWSASKRIRMSGTSTPSDSGSSSPEAPLAGAQVPNSAPGTTTTGAHQQPRPPAGAGGQADPLETRVAATVVLAEDSSSYPTTNSSAPHVSSLDVTTPIPHVSQTPDGPSQEALSTAVNKVGRVSVNMFSSVLLSSDLESSQLTEPVADTASVCADDASGENGADSGYIGAATLDGPATSSPHRPFADAASDASDDSAASGAAANDGKEGPTDAAHDNQARGEAGAAYATPPPQARSSPRRSRRLVATSAKVQRPSIRPAGPRRRTLDVPSRPRRASLRHLSTCQRLLELNRLSKSDGGLGIQMDPALAQPTRLVGGELCNSASRATASSSPSTPSHRATFSGAMRVLGDSEPMVTDLERLQYMCKVKGLIAGTDVSARESLRVLFQFTGDWVSARRHIVLGSRSLEEDCSWSDGEDNVLLQGLDSAKMEELRERKGSVEVYRRLQFLNTFYGLWAQ